jgi:hypothetical protein
MHSTKEEPSSRLSGAGNLHPNIYETVWLQVDEKPCDEPEIRKNQLEISQLQ